MRLRNALRAARSTLRGRTAAVDGPYAIGRRRLDVPTDPPTPTTWFYPAPPDATGDPVPALSAPLRQALHETLGIPLAALPRGSTAALADAPIAPGPHPLVLFLHGFGSFPVQNRRMCEALARRGHVVGAVGFPGDSLVAEFADGTVIPMDPGPAVRAQRALREDAAAAERFFGDLAALQEAARGATDAAAYLGVLDAMNAHPVFGLYTPVARRMADRVTAVLATLSTVDDPVVEQIEPRRVGLIGHSLGGAACLEVARRRRRDGQPLSALVNLDGAAMLHDGRLEPGAPVAFFHAHGTTIGGRTLSNREVNAGWLRFGSRPGVHVECARASHMAFTDLAFNRAAQAVGALGDLDGPRFGDWTHAAAITWFEGRLEGEVPILPDHPGVEVIRVG